MLTQLEVFTAGIPNPLLPVVDQNAALDYIQIKDIEGLGPVTATVNTTQYGSIDGEMLNGTFTPKRNIVITAALNPDWSSQTYETLRQVLYSYFMPETTVRLRFSSTHMATVDIVGVVESCDPDIFSSDPVYNISIICVNPYFTAANATVLSGTTQAFGSPSDVAINYEGSVETGFVVDYMLPSGGTAFTGEARVVNNTGATPLLSILTSVTVSSTQFFRLSSVQSSKYARQYPLPVGAYSSALAKWAAGSSWLSLRKGTNKLQMLSATAGLNWSLQYYAKYGGL